MAFLQELSQWIEGIYRVEKTDDVLGDDTDVISGPINVQAKQLADRTKYLKDQMDDHKGASDPHPQYLNQSELDAALGSVAFDALPFPTIQADENKLTVSTASSVNGGIVSIAQGSYISINKEIVTGISGRTELHQTPDFDSADLDTNTTYFLRANLDSSGVLQIYTTKGSDADTIPATLKGTVNGANGGGFDSTKLDMLIAKVETGNAGTVPVVTELRNTNRLHLRVTRNGGFTNYEVVSDTYFYKNNIVIDWARVPKTAPVTGYVSGADAESGGGLRRESYVVTRYMIEAEFSFDKIGGSGGTGATGLIEFNATA